MSYLLVVLVPNIVIILYICIFPLLIFVLSMYPIDIWRWNDVREERRTETIRL